MAQIATYIIKHIAVKPVCVCVCMYTHQSRGMWKEVSHLALKIVFTTILRELINGKIKWIQMIDWK